MYVYDLFIFDSFWWVDILEDLETDLIRYGLNYELDIRVGRESLYIYGDDHDAVLAEDLMRINGIDFYLK